jgi:hypothetical protein
MSAVPRKTLTTLGPYSYGTPCSVWRVRSMPPGWALSSNSVTSQSNRSRSIRAAHAPANPAPTTTALMS